MAQNKPPLFFDNDHEADSGLRDLCEQYISLIRKDEASYKNLEMFRAMYAKEPVASVWCLLEKQQADVAENAARVKDIRNTIKMEYGQEALSAIDVKYFNSPPKQRNFNKMKNAKVHPLGMEPIEKRKSINQTALVKSETEKEKFPQYVARKIFAKSIRATQSEGKHVPTNMKKSRDFETVLPDPKESGTAKLPVNAKRVHELLHGQSQSAPELGIKRADNASQTTAAQDDGHGPGNSTGDSGCISSGIASGIYCKVSNTCSVPGLLSLKKGDIFKIKCAKTCAEIPHKGKVHKCVYGWARPNYSFTKVRGLYPVDLLEATRDNITVNKVAKSLHKLIVNKKQN